MKNLYPRFMHYGCLAAFILSMIIIGCQESSKEQSSAERTAQAGIADTQAVALDGQATGMQHDSDKSLYSDDTALNKNKNYSVINLRLHSNNAMLLTDPEGRRTGVDPLSKKSFTEIPYSSYETIGIENLETGKVGPTTKELAFSKPLNGEFIIRLAGTYEDRYAFEIVGYDAAGDFGRIRTKRVLIELNSIHTYSLRYKKGNEKDLDTMTLRGGYDGVGDEGGDGNLLLSYFTCSSSEIELPAETKQYSVGIWYYEGTDPESFTATLNGEDITALFTPKANSNEIVTLDLSQSKSSLVLKIERDVQSQRLIDTDTFEIAISP